MASMTVELGEGVTASLEVAALRLRPGCPWCGAVVWRGSSDDTAGIGAAIRRHVLEPPSVPRSGEPAHCSPQARRIALEWRAYQPGRLLHPHDDEPEDLEP